jgi:exodeoxyribonuclease V alpha subunit
MTVNLDTLVRDGVLEPIHEAFARLIGRLDRGGDEADQSVEARLRRAKAQPTSSGDRGGSGADQSIMLAAALVSDQLTRGHVCLDLATAKEIAFAAGEGEEEPIIYHDWPALDDWIARLAASRTVAVKDPADVAENLDRPLVLDQAGKRLYLARYWHFQQRLAGSLVARLAIDPLSMDEARLTADIDRLFPDRKTPGGRDQCVAVANVVDRRLSVITGGPGTGKTTMVAKLLALRLLQQPAARGTSPFSSEPPSPSSSSGQPSVGARTGDILDCPPPDALRVLLMAPTGKAAQRLNESLGRAAQKLAVDEPIRAALQRIRAGTIHRTLEWTPLPPNRGGPFRYTRDFPLEADVVVVDEASMVDMGLMWRLLDAVKPDAQVILIGDRDQLASIEAGGVLSDLCGGTMAAELPQLTPSRRRIVSQRTGLELPPVGEPCRGRLADSVVNLHYSHRFDPASALGTLADDIRKGDAARVCGQLRAAAPGQIEWFEPAEAKDALAEVVGRAAEHYAEYLGLLQAAPTGSLAVIKALGRFRVLCAHRGGRWGELNFNRLIAERLEQQGLIRGGRSFQLGQPLMVTRNDYRQQLFNGDVGVVVEDRRGAGLGVLFEEAAAEGGCRVVPAALVPESKTCFAMTIHKSQGSEFHRVMVVLGQRHSPLLTRELLYTAVTRVSDDVDPETARRSPGKLYLLASEPVVRQAVERQIRRTSGLREAIASIEGVAG